MAELRKAADSFDLENIESLEFKEFGKFGKKFVYLKRVFPDGRCVYSKYDSNDPFRSEISCSVRAYAAARCPALLLWENRPK